MEDDDYGYRTGERCGIDGCRSRRYRTNEQGFEECALGHQHGLARGNIENDDDEFLGTLRGKRFRKGKVEKEKIYKQLRGKEAFELYLLSYQLILRKQVWWLVHVKKLPKELEAIVHDLWALRIQNLRTRVNHENQPGSDTESGTENDSVANLFGSQGVNETEAETDVESSRHAANTGAIPNLRQALALMYVAAQIIRLPIFLGDILRWAKSGALLYHDVASEIPREMLQRLPSPYRSQFHPKIHLTDGKLLHAVTSLVLLYNKDFRLEMPALNLPPHLFRLVQELALPLEVYPAVRRLALFMKFDFLYPSISKRRIQIIDFPEAQIVACIIVVLKLHYGFDEVRRIPIMPTSPGIAVIDWDVWERVITNSDPLEYQEAMQMTDREIIGLSEENIDDYLDFFQAHFTIDDPQDRDKDADFRKMMLGLFPVGSRSTKRRDAHPDEGVRKQENIQSMQERLTPNRVVSTMDDVEVDGKVTRPGEKYEMHRNTYQLTRNVENFYKAIANISGLPLKSIVRAVVHAENILQKLKKGKLPRGRPAKHNYKSGERVGTEDLQSEGGESDISMEEL